jgi:hypothetical protein
MEAAGGASYGDILSEADVQMLGAAKVVIESGVPEDALLQICRVSADTQARGADAVSRIFHFFFHEGLRDTGISNREVQRREDETLSRIDPLLEPAVLYFHRKGVARAMPDDIVLHLFEEAGLAEAREVPGQIVAAAMFVDLSSFTPLTVVMGDAKAAEVLERFGRVVHAAVGSTVRKPAGPGCSRRL